MRNEVGLRSRGRRARRLQEEAWERERWGRRVRRARYLVVQRRPQAVQVAFQLVLRFDLLTLVFVRLGVLFRLLPSVHGDGVRKHEWTGDKPPTTNARTLSMRSISSSDRRPLSDVMVIFWDLPDALSCADT